MSFEMIKVIVSSLEAGLEFLIEPATTGAQLFAHVTTVIGLWETWWFGLQYTDCNGDTAWIEAEREVMRHKMQKGAPLQFQLRVKIYPLDISKELTLTITKHYFYLQVKDAIMSNEIFCSLTKLIFLASYDLQMNHGDYCKEVHTSEFLANLLLLPQRVFDQGNLSNKELEELTVQCWQDRRGMSPDKAVTVYLKTAKSLEMFGINYFQMLDEQGHELCLLINANGLTIHVQDHMLIPKIKSLWSDPKIFAMSNEKLYIKTTGKSPTRFVCFAPNAAINKFIIELCIGYIDMYGRYGIQHARKSKPKWQQSLSILKEETEQETEEIQNLKEATRTTPLQKEYLDLCSTRLIAKSKEKKAKQAAVQVDGKNEKTECSEDEDEAETEEKMLYNNTKKLIARYEDAIKNQSKNCQPTFQD